MVLMLGELGRCADPIQISFEVIETDPDRLLRWRIGTQPRGRMLAVAGRHLGFETIETQLPGPSFGDHVNHTGLA
ncbi:hypothetical protein D3C79_813760 [compost metagenome]